MIGWPVPSCLSRLEGPTGALPCYFQQPSSHLVAPCGVFLCGLSPRFLCTDCTWGPACCGRPLLLSIWCLVPVLVLLEYFFFSLCMCVNRLKLIIRHDCHTCHVLEDRRFHDHPHLQNLWLS